MPPPKTKRAAKKKTVKPSSRAKKGVFPQGQDKKKAVVTDKDRIVFAQNQTKQTQLVVDELMQINAELTLTIAKQRATLKLYAAAQPRQVSSGG